jgi:hypothetical protein
MLTDNKKRKTTLTPQLKAVSTEILAAILESIKAKFNERYYAKDRATLRGRAIRAVGFDRQCDKEISHAATR